MGQEEEKWGETFKVVMEAAMMAKGMRLRRPEKPKVVEPPAGGGIKMREPVPVLEQSTISSVEGTAAWHTEVVRAVIDNKAAPAVDTSTARAHQAKTALSTPETGQKVQFLLENGIPKSDTVAVVASDIAASTFRDDPVYLVAKEAQLVHSMRSEMTLTEQAEIGKAARKIHEKIAQLRSAAPAASPIPNEVVMASDIIHLRMTSVLEEKIIDERRNPVEKDKKEDEELTVDDVHEDLKESLNEMLVVATGGEVALEAKIRLMHIPDDAATYVSQKIIDGASVKDAIKTYAREVASGGDDIQKQFVRETSDILKDPSIKKELETTPPNNNRPSGKEIWDEDKIGTTGNPELDAYLKRLQHLMDTSPRLKEDPRRLNKALEDLQDIKFNFTPEQLEAAGNPQTTLENMVKAAEEKAERIHNQIQERRAEEQERQRRLRGEGIEEQYSSMFLSTAVRQLTVIHPEWGFDQMYRKYNESVGKDTRGPVAQQLQRQLQQVVEFYASDKFVADIEQLMSNPDWRIDIQNATQTPIAVTSERCLGPDNKPLFNPDGTPAYKTDMDKIVNHPFYKDRVSRLRELSRKIQSKDTMGWSYGVMSMGKDIKKVQVEVLGGLGDKGVYDAKAEAGYLTGMTNHILDDMADVAKRDYKHGYKKRFGEKENLESQFNTQYILDAMKEEFGKIHKDHFLSRSSIKLGENMTDYENLCRKLGIKNETMEFGSKVIEGMVRDAQKLNTVTLREVYHRANALSPGASDGQNYQPPKYASESGLSAYLQARQMYEHLMERWDLLGPSGQLHMRVMAHQYAEVTGADLATKQMVDRAMKDPAYKLKLASEALDVHEFDVKSQAYKDRVKTVLAKHFTVDLKGFDVKNPPKSLESLTREQLTEVVNFKQGMKFADLVIGGYGYEGATWVCKPKMTMYDLIYGKDAWTRGIGIGDAKRLLGGEFTAAESAHQREEVAHKLIHGEHGQPGILHVQGEYATTRSFQDLIEHMHYETMQKHTEMVNAKFYEGTFTDIRTKEPVVITADRPDLAIQYMKITDRVTDELLSFQKTGGDPINWHDGPTPAQDKILTTVCTKLGVNKEKFIALKKELSHFVTQEPQLERLTMSDMIDTYIDVQDLESREKFLDSPLDAPGSKYAENRRHADEKIVDMVSGMIGDEAGKSDKCGIARVAGDNGTAQGSAATVSKIMGIRSFEPLLKLMPELKESILFTYGQQFASRGVAVVAGSWMDITSMDRADDWLIVGSIFNKRENSPIKRVTKNTGDHGDMASTINERHGMWSQLQKDINETFGAVAPEMNLYMEKNMGLVREYTGWDGKHHHDDLPLKIYQGYLVALGMLGLATISGANTAAEGTKEGMGGGGGGSGGGGAHGGGH